MNRKLASAVACTATALAVSLVGCGSGESSKVSGALDDVKHVKEVKAVTKPATRTVTDYKNECKTKTRTKTVNGNTSTEPYQDCRRVTAGSHTESYKKVIKPGKPARYCVELDNVDGKNGRDDVWYRVNSTTYFKWSEETEGTAVKNMEYLAKGC